MAFDKDGNYYFDPNDYEDKELVFDELKRERARSFMQAQKNLAQDQKTIGDTWLEALKSEELDPAAYAELVNQDPELAKELLKAGMKNMVAGVKRGGKGKKESQSGGRKEAGGRTVKKADTKLVESVWEKASKGRMTDDDRIDVIDALIGNLI
jgi:hypothetical protein